MEIRKDVLMELFTNYGRIYTEDASDDPGNRSELVSGWNTDSMAYYVVDFYKSGINDPWREYIIEGPYSIVKNVIYNSYANGDDGITNDIMDGWERL